MREERADQAAGRVPVRPGSLLASRLTRVVTEAIPGGRGPTRPEAGEAERVSEGSMHVELGQGTELKTPETTISKSRKCPARDNQ